MVIATPRQIEVQPSTDTLGASRQFKLVTYPTKVLSFIGGISLSTAGLVSYFPVEVEYSTSEQCIISTSKVSAHGVGDTVQAATRDFMSAVKDLYHELEDSEAELGPHLLRELDYLRKYFD